MAHENMTTDDIQDELNEFVSDTGEAKITVAGELYIKAAENRDWQFHGTVANVPEAKATLSEFFNR